MNKIPGITTHDRMMKRINFPAGYQQVMPYLVTKDAEALITFLKDVFGAEEKMRFMRDEHTIAHAEVTIGHSVIMISGAADELKPCPGGSFVFVENADATYQKAMTAGASSLMPVKDNPYGRSGGVLDPFGNSWWMKTHDPGLMPGL
jgi:PhnB protein